ncbi:MAG: hypothetical protein ACRESK_01645 [Gammaproteobacteria bacterium]
MVGRKENLVESTEISTTIPVRLERYLKMLVRTGFYGTRPGEAVNKIVSNTIEAMVDSGKLNRIPSDDETDDEQENGDKEKK